MKAVNALLTTSLALLLANPAQADLNSDLVAHWTFDACNGVDATGRGHDMSFFGDAAVCEAGPRRLGQAHTFNGTNNYFVSATSADFAIDAAVTYAGWIKPAAFGSYIFHKYTGGENKYLILGLDQKLHFYLNNCMSGVDLPSADSVALNEWTHIAATYDGDFVRIYLNGVPSGIRGTSASCNVTDSSGNVHIGRRGNSNADWFKGSMDDLRVYQRPLTATEVSQLYRRTVKAKIEGTAPWATEHTVTCKNVTQGTEVVLPPTKRDDWNCEGANLQVNSGDTVQVVIDGTRQ